MHLSAKNKPIFEKVNVQLNPGNPRLAELDYLRGLACLMVVIFHYCYKGPLEKWTGLFSLSYLAPIASYGHWGVPLFFMISGFVIYKSAIGRTTTRFAKSRFWRLYPAYWVAILLTSTVVFLTDYKEFKIGFWDIVLNLTMFQNWINVPSVDGVYWSLFVEMTFYIWIMFAIQIKQINRVLQIVGVWLAISIANLFVNSYWIDAIFIAKWGPYFCLGILAYRIRESKNSLASSLLSVAAVGTALCQVYLDGKRKSGQVHWDDLLIVTILIALFFGTLFLGKNSKETRLSKFAGNVTYPLYLIHQNIGYVMLAYLVKMLNPELSLLSCVLIIVAFSYVIHRYIEIGLVSKAKKL